MFGSAIDSKKKKKRHLELKISTEEQKLGQKEENRKELSQVQC